MKNSAKTGKPSQFLLKSFDTIFQVSSVFKCVFEVMDFFLKVPDVNQTFPKKVLFGLISFRWPLPCVSRSVIACIVYIFLASSSAFEARFVDKSRCQQREREREKKTYTCMATEHQTFHGTQGAITSCLWPQMKTLL